MSIVGFLERIGGTSRLSIEREFGEFKLVVTRPPVSHVRLIAGFFVGAVGVCALAMLLYPYVETRDGNITPWLAIAAIVWLIVFAFNDGRLRAKYQQEVTVRPEKLIVAGSNFSTLPVPIEFETVRITVATTIPMVRGGLEFRERNSGRVLTFCENTPYYQRCFAARKIADELNLELTFDRPPTDHELEQIKALECSET